MNANTSTLIKLTNGFAPDVPLARVDELIRDVRSHADEEDKRELGKYRPYIKARREQGLVKRQELKEGIATQEELAPYLDEPDPRAPKDVLRLVITFPLFAIFLTVGLCCLYAVDAAYLEAHSALVYFAVGSIVFAGLMGLTALFAFISYCKIRRYNKTLPERNLEKRDEAIADLDGQVAYEIMLADLLLKKIDE